MVKILMLTGDAGEAQEIYYAKFRLEEEGWQVHIAIPEKRVFHSVVHDFEPGFDTYTEKAGYRVQADLGLDDVAVEQYQGLVLPGGRAPEYLRNRPRSPGDRSPFPEFGQADCRQLPRSLACCWLRQACGEGRLPAILISSPTCRARAPISSTATSS